MAQAARRGASPQRWDGIYRQRLQQSTANPDEHLAGARLPQSNPINPRCRPAPHLRMRTPRHGAATALSERSRVISESPGTRVPAAHLGHSHSAAERILAGRAHGGMGWHSGPGRHWARHCPELGPTGVFPSSEPACFHGPDPEGAVFTGA